MIQYHSPIKWTVQIKVSKLFMGKGIGERQVFVPGQINLTNYTESSEVPQQGNL